ncbi:hypothetical protein MTZ49_07370 [Entomomonas sp. E2T0]|uniref:hypothetical protein n=1 Tax=Entomomonas sp. E2T0 TaxID=2930213 RepID=UPI002228260E|nr:hypothetical protein [Entomomonas sp. E2T0]UYZ85358.1 hypothetical protein MTZ49_07370 [Entomomonas sp. E2T0]
MDLIQVIKDKINTLENGDYSKGLNAILTHIEVAFRHLERGQKGDFQCFTDVIYRTNQAFEGSIKELYRVLTHKDPSKKTLNDIESYFTDSNIFRPRVLEQFTSYRKNWRNPSTHDYHLDFDDREAYLAIITVSAFSYLLISQIEDTLISQKVEKEIKSQSPTKYISPIKNNDFIADTLKLLEDFCSNKSLWNMFLVGTVHPMIREHHVISALEGYFKSVTSDISLTVEPSLNNDVCPDAIFAKNDEKIILELKAYRRKSTKSELERAIVQVNSYMNLTKINTSIIFYYASQPSKFNIQEITNIDNKIIILTPEIKI